MKILVIARDKFHVGALIHERSNGALSCSLLDDFDSIEATLEKSRDRLLAYLYQVSKDGLTSLNTAQCHQVDAENKVFEFISGRIRILFFVGEPRNLVICSHMFLKKTQRTPPKELTKAIKARTLYNQSQLQGLVEWKNEI